MILVLRWIGLSILLVWPQPTWAFSGCQQLGDARSAIIEQKDKIARERDPVKKSDMDFQLRQNLMRVAHDFNSKYLVHTFFETSGVVTRLQTDGDLTGMSVALDCPSVPLIANIGFARSFDQTVVTKLMFTDRREFDGILNKIKTGDRVKLAGSFTNWRMASSSMVLPGVFQIDAEEISLRAVLTRLSKD